MRYRQSQVESQQAVLEALYAKLQALEKEEKNLAAERVSADQVVKSQSSTMALSLLALDSFSRHVTRRKTDLEESKVDCLRRIAEQQVCVVQARREHELLVRIQQRRKQEWQQAWEKEQDELASELYLAKWPRERSA